MFRVPAKRSRGCGSNDVTSVAFSPNGQTLATGSDDGTARLWSVSFPDNLLGAVCAIAGGASLPRQEWDSVVPSEPYQRACS